jgi:hypothetical protein
MDTDGLAARVGALEDERAIHAVLHRYGHAIDYGLEQEWIDCFTPDAVFEIRARVTGRHMIASGTQQLAAFAARHTRAPGRFHKHLVADVLVTMNGREAHAESLYARLDATRDGHPYVFSFGRYRDRLRKCDDDVWRLCARIAESESLSERDRPVHD